MFYNRHRDRAKKTTRPKTLLSPARESGGVAALLGTTAIELDGDEPVVVLEEEENVVAGVLVVAGTLIVRFSVQFAVVVVDHVGVGGVR